MTSKEKNIIILILALIVLAGVAVFSYSRYPIWNPITEVHDTIIKVDTVHHTIISEYPYYISKTDTIIIRDTIPAIVDTALILQAYYSLYHYQRVWQDSSLKVTLKDVISENKVMDSWFDYQITRPQTIINTTNYSRYVYAGLTIPVMNPKYTSINAWGSYSRTLIGIGYVPYQNGLQLSGAYRIIKFK